MYCSPIFVIIEMRIEMQRLNISDLYDIAETVHNENVHDKIDDILIVAKYNEIKLILEHLISLSHPVEFIELWDYEWNNYDREFYLAIVDNKIHLSPAYGRISDGYKKNTYLETCATKTYLFENCNSQIIKYIESNVFVEFGFKNNNEEIYDNNDNYIVENISIDRKNGQSCGFSKSWHKFTNENDTASEFISITYSNSNKDILEKIASIFDVKL